MLIYTESDIEKKNKFHVFRQSLRNRYFFFEDIFSGVQGPYDWF